MMKLNQSMNSNYGGGSENLIKKSKKKGSKGLNGNAGYPKTPLDFESSMSSNSALLMMDGGTGSEGINMR